LGIGLVVAALSISHKDWNRLLNLILYVGLFVSPVIYGAPLIPHAMQPVLFANPMAGALEAIRACVDGMVAFPTGPWLYSLAFTAACLGLGVTLFRRAERGFVDRL
jgi:lipopolysaccharide transport system permease protein